MAPICPSQVDELQGNFRTHSILCMPIKNACGQVIGVSQLVNKLDQTPFNKNDENLFEVRSIICDYDFIIVLNSSTSVD